MHNKISLILISIAVLIFFVVLIPSAFAVYQGAGGHWYADDWEFCGKTNIDKLDDDSWKHEPGRPITDQVEFPVGAGGGICRDTDLNVKGVCYNDEKRYTIQDTCASNNKDVLECIVVGVWSGLDDSYYLGFTCPGDQICYDGKCQPPPCDCSGVGWQDPDFWEGCSDCTSNSTNNCTPCGEAQAYCDGCNWNTDWWPFRDEYYSGTGPGHKCPGTSCNCYEYGAGWHDYPYWGGCGDCTSNSVNKYPPCGEAQAYCDGCNWDTEWWPFRDEYYSGTGPGHKCPGTSCNCYEYGAGWHDYPYWGGCGDCTSNSTNNCTPCGEALAYCDGCNWNTGWWPFVNDNDSWSTSGHKCPGSPKICTPNDKWCDPSGEGGTAWTCSSDGCSKSSVYCDTNYWTNDYTCLGTMRQRRYVYRGCSGGSCYANPIFYDWEQCNDYDNCYAYSNGCEDRDYYCSSGACTYSVSNRHTDYYDAYVNYCADAINLRTHRLLHDYYCTGITCTDHTSWQNDSFVENCNGRDQCIGSTWRDWYCSGTACAYTDYPGHSNCNQAPTIPIRNSPLDNWQNTNPTFSVTSTDPNGNQYRSYFNILGYGDNWSGWTNSGQPASWGPINLGTCFSNWWRAYSQDTFSFNSAWSGYWQIRVDKDNPSSSISYPTGTYTSLTFTVSLTESDACSGINSGDVDIKIKPSGGGWGNWQDYLSTINDFPYTGIDGYSYQFRYRVKDAAGNWSNFAEGGEILIDLNDPPTVSCNDAETWNSCVDSRNPALSWNYSDPDGDPQGAYQIQIDTDSGFSAPITIDVTADPSSSNTYQPSGTTLQWGAPYFWHVRVKDSNNNWSVYSSNCSFTTLSHAYPNVDFNWAPQNPSALENVKFSDNSACYDDVITGSDCTKPNDSYNWAFTGSGTVNWDWDKGDARTLEFPVVSFSNPGSWSVKLEVTDNTGFMCPNTKSVNVSYPLPEWEEVIPR